MLNLKQQLPPLNALITFEAAARHLSFTLAANELNVTQAAVSRQIKNLEQHLGVALFNRYNRRLTLTIAAQQLLPNLLSAIALIIDSVAQISTVEEHKTVTIAATIAFTTFKLNDWLSQFLQQHRDIEVRVIATDRDVDLQREGVTWRLAMATIGRTITCAALSCLTMKFSRFAAQNIYAMHR